MRKLFLTAVAVAVPAIVMWAADWPTPSGSPQRDGWARAEKAFTADNAKNIELLYKYKADNRAKGLNALTSPLVNGMLITYLGFKEMLVFGGSDDNVYSIDADLNRIIWKRHFETHAAATSGCSGALTAGVAMPGSSSAAGRGGPGGRGLFATGFGRSGVFVAVSSDGFLHALNTSTGEDKVPPVPFVPANSRLSALNINDSVVYAATLDNCGGVPPALYALDMSGDTPKRSVYAGEGLPAAGSAGTAVGASGTLYTQTDAVRALTKDLQTKDWFGPIKGDSTPLVFQAKGRELIVAGSDDHLYLLDGASLGGPDHHTPLSVLETPGSHFRGAFSSWEDAKPDGNNIRWIYTATTNGVAAYRVAELNGIPAFFPRSPVWTSANIPTPGPPVTANGLVFALSSGEPAGHAVLHVLDGTTGKELYSSGSAVTSFTHDPALAIANRRIYFTTHDNTVYAFGFMADQPQLTGK